MQQNLLVVLALLTAQLNALPLNINLGAYSPALVVGDGEISFGGKQDVSNLMNALEGAAVSGATAAAAAAPANAVTPAAAASASASTKPITQAQVVPTNTVAPIDQSTQITSLQGMGKEIAPRVVPLVKVSSSTTSEKRDIQGFNAALNYASGALKSGPEIQLGTGEGGSGVGITQKAGSAVAAANPATTSRAAARARSLREGRSVDMPARKLKTTVTTMFVRGGPSQAQTEVVAERSEDTIAMEKHVVSPSTIDGVNLNMAEGQVAELTFVETRAVDEDEDDE